MFLFFLIHSSLSIPISLPLFTGRSTNQAPQPSYRSNLSGLFLDPSSSVGMRAHRPRPPSACELTDPDPRRHASSIVVIGVRFRWFLDLKRIGSSRDEEANSAENAGANPQLFVFVYFVLASMEGSGRPIRRNLS